MSVGWLVLVAFIVFFVIVARQSMRWAKDAAAAREKQEALFKAAFPELQPHFHPEKVLQFVAAWDSLGGAPENHEWNYPPGLGFAKARVGPMGSKGRPIEFLDRAGAVVSRALLADH